METIHTMPKWMGEQFYPGGFPLKADSIFYEGGSIEQIFIRSALVAETKKDRQVLHDYTRYYMRAPVWRISDKERERLDKLSYTDLCAELIILGLNPF